MSSWNKQYYDNMCFYFWEPQHIGRSKGKSKKIYSESGVREHLASLEVALNHQMSLFFRLAPNNLLLRLIERGFDKAITDQFVTIGREFDERYGTNGLTQPDLFFEGSSHVLAIELKLGAKSAIEQVVKYALLMSLAGGSSAKESYLLFMGPSTFPKLWKEQFASVEQIKAAAGNLEGEALGQRWMCLFNEKKDAIHRTLEKMSIAFLSYQSFYDFLVSEAAEIPSGCETYLRLIDGMVDELRERRLAAKYVP